jgi:hypothetical protein
MCVSETYAAFIYHRMSFDLHGSDQADNCQARKHVYIVKFVHRLLLEENTVELGYNVIKGT